MSTQTFSLLSEQSLRPELHIVRKAEAIVSLNVAEVCSDNPEELYYEDKLGCARGVVFALAFQGLFVAVAAICWKLLLH
jgi:hypothetical protein